MCALPGRRCLLQLTLSYQGRPRASVPPLPPCACACRRRAHAPSLTAKSSRFAAATSTGAEGAASPLPGPCSFGRATWPVRSPHFAAATRSSVCAATIMHSPGGRSKASQAARYTRGLRLKSPAISAPRIASQGKVLRRARSTISEILPFDTGASRKRRLSRARPPGASGQAGRRCHARLRLRAASSARLETPKRGRMRSRFSRCSRSSLQKGLRPARTSSNAGWYSLRQASAKAGQSSLCPAAPRMLSASRATPVRKSTSVPKTSKNSALTVIACMRVSWSLRSRRLHALRLEHLGGSRAGQRFEQGLGRLAFLGLRANAGGVDRVVLDICWQRTDERDAFHGKDFADLVDAKFGLALGDVRRHRPAGNQFCLRLHLAGDPELREKPRDIDAAGAAGGGIDIGSGLGREQRPFEGFDRADVGLRRTLVDHDADPDTGKVDPAAGNELAFAGKIVHRRR